LFPAFLDCFITSASFVAFEICFTLKYLIISVFLGWRFNSILTQHFALIVVVTFIQLHFFLWDTAVSESRRFRIWNLNLMKLRSAVLFTLAKRSSFIFSVNDLSFVYLKQLAIVFCKSCLFDLIFERFIITSISFKFS